MDKSTKKVCIQSYKHDEQIHRIWKSTSIIKRDENVIITAHKKTKVIEKNGRTWYTKEPAVCYFYFKRWFNVIAMIKKDGLYFYCNVSSPVVLDNEGIKYIDYDLDIKVFPNGDYHILDQKEYAYHANKMAYQEDLKVILEEQIHTIINMVKNQESPFNQACVWKDYESFLEQEK